MGVPGGTVLSVLEPVPYVHEEVESYVGKGSRKIKKNLMARPLRGGGGGRDVKEFFYFFLLLFAN